MMKKSDDKTAKLTDPVAPHGAGSSVTKKRAPWPYITIGIFGTVLVMAALALAWLQFFSFGKAIMSDSQSRRDQQSSLYEDDESNERGPNENNRGGGLSSVAAVGVVSEIEDDILTVIGSGERVTVTVTDTTRIMGDESDIAVNDSVIIFGKTNDDGSIVATRIIVANDDILEAAPSRERPQVRSSVPSA